MTDAELEELLDTPESAEEKEALDSPLVSDPEEILWRTRLRLQTEDPQK